MAFTERDRDALRKARIAVAELEIKERAALSALHDALHLAGLGTGGLPDMAEVAEHADAIRDALAPFASGYRAAQDDS